MNYEENRLETFSRWPQGGAGGGEEAVEPVRIAQAGFYYTGRGQELQCFACGGKLALAEPGACRELHERHRRLDPRCPFLRDPRTAGNVPLLLPELPGASRTSPLSSSPPVESTPALPPRSRATDEDEMYRNDALRLLSYTNWPVSFISRESLASAGFYHAGGGTVRCAWCGGELCGGWRQGDQPLEEHRRHFPTCEYVCSAITQMEHIVIDAPSSLPETPLVGSPQQWESQPQNDAVEHNWRILDGLPWRGLGVISGGTEGARHPARSSHNSRLSTFTGWPGTLKQTPALLAEAGFFYTGTDDQVRCFYCDGGLGKWEPNDLPWMEHARWFPECGYVLLVKGREFVERFRFQRPNLLSEEEITNALRPTTVNRVQYPVQHPVTEAQHIKCGCVLEFTIALTDLQAYEVCTSRVKVESEMEGVAAMQALGAGLCAARVRTAIRRRLRNMGSGFTSAEALIDAALNEQLNEEAWSGTPQHQRLARDILTETLGTFIASNHNRQAETDTWDDVSSPGDGSVTSDSLTPPQPPAAPAAAVPTPPAASAASPPPALSSPPPDTKSITLEEENRQLKEARLCKVCMDNEVSVVFLPCGHLVSCGPCGASLTACPLCRAAVRALVRAYLA